MRGSPVPTRRVAFGSPHAFASLMEHASASMLGDWVGGWVGGLMRREIDMHGVMVVLAIIVFAYLWADR